MAVTYSDNYFFRVPGTKLHLKHGKKTTHGLTKERGLQILTLITMIISL